MAMKFWFGKKDAEPDACGGAVCGAQAIPGGVASDTGAVSPIAELASAAVPASKGEEPKVVQPLQASVAATVDVQVAKPSGSPTPADMKAVVPVAEIVTPVAGPAVQGAAPKLVLKAVGGSVRLTPRPAGEGVAATPPAAVENAAGHPTFGLRPKAENSPTAEATGVVERDVEGVLVRPKMDQRALYYQLMNGLYDAVLVLDDHGHVVDCNSRVTEMLGYSREETWDLPIDKIITGMTSQMFDHLKRNLAEHHHILIDARCTRQDGTSLAVEVGVSTISLTRGNNMVFAFRNVERRKNAMDELRKGRAALDIALAPAFVCDTDGCFVVVNQALLDSFGIPDENQAKSVRFMDVLPDAARLFLRASSGEKVRETLSVPTPGGLPVKLQLALSPVQGGQNITGVAGSILQM